MMYAKKYFEKTIKLRLSDEGDGNNWYENLIWLYSNPKSKRAPREKSENKQLESYLLKEAQKMPITLKGFENHPMFDIEFSLYSEDMQSNVSAEKMRSCIHKAQNILSELSINFLFILELMLEQ